MNTVMMSFASSAELLKDKENCFPEHILDMYKQAAKHDLSFTHTFITPQVNRSQSYFGLSEKPISAKVIDRTEKGLIIHGARLLATQGGLTDEILVFSAPKFSLKQMKLMLFHSLLIQKASNSSQENHLC